ncbi:MAG TPA: RimK/LysX family protein [Arenimonas sp.]|nr:RimK/LysX family protein [Arenimonas sp.]
MAQPVRLGWREWLALPDLGIVAMRVKVDTGARTSALHVEFQESFHRDGAEWVRFALATGVPGLGDSLAEAPVLDRRRVTDSGGHGSERIFIRTTLCLAGQRWEAELNLTHRRELLFPMLLGRTALAGRFVVDPAASFLHGQEPPLP